MTEPDPARPTKAPQAGGVLLAAGLLGGSVIGAVLGQPTIGFLAGGAAGVALALLVWLRERR